MSMNKILIVGHPQSGYQEVERLLRACGMAPALPSRREGFAPDQISETLCKAHHTPALHRLGNDREVQQVDVAPVWQSLAMDLMLGNIDQPLWGWADPKAVYLLDYWLTLDPSLHFILVYDRPHSVLTRMGLQEAASLTREALQQRLDAWSAYNAAVLGFHLRHPEHCLLVHSEQVHRSAEASLQQVRVRIDAPWKDRFAGHATTSGSLTTTEVDDAKPGSQSLSLDDHFTIDASALSTVVVSALLKDQLGSQALYEELQASANLPLEADLALGEDPALGFEAWHSLIAQRERLQNQRELTRKLQIGHDEVAQLTQRFDALVQLEAVTHERLAAEEAARQKAQQKVSSLSAEIESLKAQPSAKRPGSELAEENELLLRQLHHVQEELERYFLESQRLRGSSVAAPTTEHVTSQSRELYGAADRVKRQLSYRLGACMITNSRNLGGWIRMPFALMRESREFRHDRQQTSGHKLPPISAYCDAYEAERIKQHLSYRLGQVFIANSRNPLGWMRMAFAIRREVQRFREQRRN